MEIFSYFFVYLLNDDDTTPTFVFEGNNINDYKCLIYNAKSIIDDRKIREPDYRYYHSKWWFALGCEYSSERHQFIFKEDYRDNTSCIISFRNRYSRALPNAFDMRPKDDYRISVSRRIATCTTRFLTSNIKMLLELVKHHELNMYRGNINLVIECDDYVDTDKLDEYKKSVRSFSSEQKKICSMLLSYIFFLIRTLDFSTHTKKYIENEITTLLNQSNDFNKLSGAFVECYDLIISKLRYLSIEQKLFCIDRFKVLQDFLTRYSGNISDYKIKIPLSMLDDEVLDCIKIIVDDKSTHLIDEEHFSVFNDFFEYDLTPLSDGERAYLDLFASIMEQINIDCLAGDKQSYILLFDEPEINMHPELARCFIYNLIELVKMYKGKTFQIITSTHSPFVLSDIQKDCVIFIDKKEDNNLFVFNKVDLSQTFASNIHSLLSDGFFMSNTKGQYAVETINELIKIATSENTIDDRYYNKILLIGEPLIRNKLLSFCGDNANRKKKEFYRCISSMDLSQEQINEIYRIVGGSRDDANS